MRVLGEGVAIKACIEDVSCASPRAGRHSHARNALVPRVCGVSAPVCLWPCVSVLYALTPKLGGAIYSPSSSTALHITDKIY